MVDIKEVKKYWEENPLFSLEVKNPGSPEFFEALDNIKRHDVERFAFKYWEFNNSKNKKLLDVGCGPGWVTVNYALGGAQVWAIDLTARAVELARKFLEYKNTSANVQVGDAEKLEFEDSFFDIVVSSGVLHHTPDFCRAFKECWRVLKPGGRAKITLYHKGILHNRFVFPALKFLMRIFGVARPGTNLANAKNADDFIRQYDGIDNPVGIGKNVSQWRQELEKVGFITDGYELHFFPRRFIPFFNFMPNFVHHLLDKYFGTMIYFNLRKPV